jgi:mediator of RNA polymerase II transcription subunit 31
MCSYPGPSLRALELLQQESFRRDILRPDVMVRLFEEGIQASVEER